MIHKFVIPTILILLIGIACSPIGSPEPLTEENRITTAEAVAAQPNQEIGSTDTPALDLSTETVIPTDASQEVAEPQDSATSPPTPLATPTQDLAELPTATQTPTVQPAATQPAAETSALLAVGDTIYFDPFAVTLVSANVGDSFEATHLFEEDGSQRVVQAREGYTFVYFDLEYVVTKFDPKTIPLNLFAKAIDKDGDTYDCQTTTGMGLTFRLIQGYRGYFQMFCEAPLTAISSLDQVQLEVKSFLQMYTFDLDKQTQKPVGISVETEREKYFSMDQPFTVICGTQYHVEYVFSNPRWLDYLRENRWGFKMFSVDLVMTNSGKTNAGQIMFQHALFFDGIGYEEPLHGNVPREDIVRDFPIPGGTGMYRLHFALPPTDVVPLVSYWPQPGFEKGCEIKIGDYMISDNPDYFVYEIQSTGG